MGEVCRGRAACLDRRASLKFLLPPFLTTSLAASGSSARREPSILTSAVYMKSATKAGQIT